MLELGDNKLEAIENVGHLLKLEKLYLGANRIKTIAGVDSLASLRTLSLPCNCIEQVPDLAALRHLRELYLAQNGIRAIGVGLRDTAELEVLDLQHNLITVVDNVAHLSKLTDLWIGSNKVGLPAAHSLHSLQIEDLPSTLAELRRLPALRTLYTQMNPFAADEPAYRRKCIMALPQITRLDHTPCRSDGDALL